MKGPLVVAAVVVALATPACDDAIRAGKNAGPVMDDAARWLDDVLRLSDDAARARAATRFGAIADEYDLEPRVEEALTALAWDVGCDLVTGSVDPDNLEAWIVERGLDFGLSIVDGAAANVADMLSTATSGEAATDAKAACAALPDSGI